MSLRPPDIQYVAHSSHYLVLAGVGGVVSLLRPPQIYRMSHRILIINCYLVLDDGAPRSEATL